MMVFWDMIVSLGSVWTSRVGAWVVHDFSCVALSYLSFSNDARVFVTRLIRNVVPPLPMPPSPHCSGGIGVAGGGAGGMPHKRSVFGTDWKSTPRRRYTDTSHVLLAQKMTSVHSGTNILQSRLL